MNFDKNYINIIIQWFFYDVDDNIKVFCVGFSDIFIDILFQWSISREGIDTWPI